MPLAAGQSYSTPTRGGLLKYLEFLRAQTFHVRLARGTRTSDTTSIFGSDLQTIEQATESAFIQKELLQIEGYAPALVTLDTPIYDTANDYAKIPRFTANFSPTVDWTLGYDCAAIWINGSSIASRPVTAINTTTSVLTAVGHGLANGDNIMLAADTVPAGASTSQIYKAVNVATDTFKISTDGTNAINLTTAGSNVILKYAKGTLFHLLVAPQTLLAYSGSTFPVVFDTFLGSFDPVTRMLQ